MGNFLIGMLNEIIKGLASALNLIFSLLPTSPFQLVSNSGVGNFLNNLGWIIPVSQILSILQAWATAIGIYYVVQVGLRWIKAIE